MPGRRAAAFGADRARRAAETDRWLASLLGDEAGVALVAVGGYGRRELLPGSDLDVLLLHAGRPDISVLADRIWYPIWDSGTRLDHAVRIPREGREVARGDLRAALGLLHARHVAGDPGLTAELRLGVLADWRAAAGVRLAELQALHAERAQRSGELAFLLEPDLKEARGGLRDANAIHAVAAAWVAPGPGPRVRAAHEFILDTRHALHEVTGRRADRLVLQEQDEVARVLELADADALLGCLAGAGRTVAYALDQSFRQAQRSRARPGSGRARFGLPGTGQGGSGLPGTGLPGTGLPGTGQHGGGPARRGSPPVSAHRRPLAEGLVEQDGEVVLARSADPATDPVLPLRAAAAAAQAGLALAPRALARLAGCPPLPVPWPAEARDALASLLGAGQAAICVWEALDQEELITRLLPDWERVRNRPQRNPLHTFTVDRHLVETAARAAALTRTVARPDLLLIAALLHDIGKGWPGDHRLTGEVLARDTAARLGLGAGEADLVARAVRHHLLLPQTATRRDLDDPVTVAQVVHAVGGRPLLELLHALAIADGQATGPAAWNDWKAGLVSELVRRVAAALGGDPPPAPLPLRAEQIALAAGREPAVMATGPEVTVAAPDRPGLLWQAAGVLASHRLAVRSANASSCGDMAVIAFTVAHQYGEPPDAVLVASDLRRTLAGQLDVAQRLRIRDQAAARPAAGVAPPTVTLVDDASHTATVVEVRAHDAPGLLWRIGRALGECGLDLRAARVETL
ncbi:MAG TPA: [protein-PII] uridylyltransferase, partial [Streptosporangiaceae bacterium]|nr:[protein-PII] uridylyltransferase [Streptosporangiaceae bacterium]